MELVLLALGTLVSEDLACIAAGALVAQGRHSLLAAITACFVGIFVGDMLLYLAGRAAWKGLPRFVSEDRILKAQAWLSERGPYVVFISRFVPGMRLPTYVAAGLLRADATRFTLYFLAASLIWTPLLVGASASLWSKQIALATIAAAVLLRVVLSWKTRRRITGWMLRKVRWEFWPAWAAYLPLIPYLLHLAVKHRSLTVFTAANPGIVDGGFAGESKIAILDQLDPSFVARYALIPSHLMDYARVNRARQFLTSFPVVLKPDVGERGNGVCIAKTQAQLEGYLREVSGDVIIQEYIPGGEYGVFVVNDKISSITRKILPSVIGDGVRTLEELIYADDRAVCMADAYIKEGNNIPTAGQRVQLVELGSHCKGAVFLDGRLLLTPQLEQAIERLSRSFKGFHYGRFDLRSPSPEHFQQGMFRVLELNGVTSEPTHVYDPAVSIWEAYRTMAAHWRMAFEIGSANQAAGHKATPALELFRKAWMHTMVSDAPSSKALRDRRHNDVRPAQSGSVTRS